MAANQLSKGIVDGTSFGQSATDLISFYGATTVARRAAAAQATLSVTITASLTCVGFTTTAQMQTLLDQLKEVRDSLVAYGLWKGAA